MILNELSLETGDIHKEEIKRQFSDFLKICQELKRKKEANI